MMSVKMPRTTVTFLDRPYKYLKMASAVLDVSITQVLNDIVEYVSEEIDEADIWEHWKDLFEEFGKTMEETGEEEEEEEEESESETDAQDKGSEEEEG